MLISGLTDHQISYALEQTNRKYGGNLEFADGINSLSNLRHRVRLRTKNSREYGSRRSASGRRIPSACWHASRDFYRALFDVNGATRITTALANYKNWDDFEDTYKVTGNINVGGMVAPVTMPELCDC